MVFGMAKSTGRQHLLAQNSHSNSHRSPSVKQFGVLSKRMLPVMFRADVRIGSYEWVVVTVFCVLFLLYNLMM